MNQGIWIVRAPSVGTGIVGTIRPQGKAMTIRRRSATGTRKAGRTLLATAQSPSEAEPCLDLLPSSHIDNTERNVQFIACGPDDGRLSRWTTHGDVAVKRITLAREDRSIQRNSCPGSRHFHQ